jgi:hypothetical protein
VTYDQQQAKEILARGIWHRWNTGGQSHYATSMSGPALCGDPMREGHNFPIMGTPWTIPDDCPKCAAELSAILYSAEAAEAESAREAALQEECEKLRAGMRVLAKKWADDCGDCPVKDHRCQSDYACEDRTSCDQVVAQEVDCWCKWAMAEADARKAGDAQ